MHFGKETAVFTTPFSVPYFGTELGTEGSVRKEFYTEEHQNKSTTCSNFLSLSFALHYVIECRIRRYDIGGWNDR